MSAAASAFTFSLSPNPLNLTHLLQRNTSLIVFSSASTSIGRNLKPPSLRRQLLFGVPIPHGSFKRSSSIFTPSRHFFSPVMEWQDCTVKSEIDVPVSVAYNAYSDRESIPRWMPFISSVKILEDKPELSKWSLKYKAFGRDIEFSWLARNMQPIPNQKIHWRSLEGLPNRGAVRFFPKGPSSCIVELTVSYEVPQLLAPFASALKPFLETLLRRGLDRFATFAKSY
ncbi:hypothetical protein AB3S75_021695 [Citrus x aurantiifolia]